MDPSPLVGLVGDLLVLLHRSDSENGTGKRRERGELNETDLPMHRSNAIQCKVGANNMCKARDRLYLHSPLSTNFVIDALVVPEDISQPSMSFVLFYPHYFIITLFFPSNESPKEELILLSSRVCRDKCTSCIKANELIKESS